MTGRAITYGCIITLRAVKKVCPERYEDVFAELIEDTSDTHTEDFEGFDRDFKRITTDRGLVPAGLGNN